MTVKIAPSAEVEAAHAEDLATALRVAHLHGFHEGIDNHFSVALGPDRFMLNRYGPHWSEITAEDILTIDVEGSLLAGDGTYEKAAFYIHRAVHLARPDATVVFHTHMPYATAVALSEGGLDTTLSQAAMYFHNRVRMVPYDGLATAEEEGERLRGYFAQDAEGTTDVVLLENHGVVVVGRTVAEAWQRMYFLERACQLQVTAQSTGQPLRRVADEVAARTYQQFADTEEPTAQALFDAMRRMVSRPSASAVGATELIGPTARVV